MYRYLRIRLDNKYHDWMAELTFTQRARSALAQPRLQHQLAVVTQRFVSHRERAFAELGVEGGRLRDLGKAIRARTLAELDQHLARAALEVERAGGVVHWAADADEARRIVVDLATARGVQRVVKTKSMVSEEIELNHTLIAAGMESVETDLGEWIVQLAGERPSHILGPALHKTKEDVAELFARVVGHPVKPEVESLLQLARRELREKFLNAQMGISGANFVVAETGTLVLVTNEGNGRLSTGLPPLHVAITGIEKVVPTWDDLLVLLALLPRSASGQKISSYVSLITGPRRSQDADGPQELHLIFLDNGRTQLLGSELREALHCIRCGACLNACPVYTHIGGHAYGWTYPGPIGAILTPVYAGLAEFHDLPHASSLCAACRDICPVRIDIPRMLVALREQEVAARVPSFFERAVFKMLALVLRSPILFRLAVRVGYIAQRPFVHAGRIQSLPLFFWRWTEARDFPRIAAMTFHDRWERMNRMVAGNN